MIDRILKTYGEVNTTANGFPPENVKKNSKLKEKKIIFLNIHVCMMEEKSILHGILLFIGLTCNNKMDHSLFQIVDMHRTR